MNRPRFWKEITIVLCAKVVLMTCLYLAFFSPSHRTVTDEATVTARLLGADHR